MSIIHVLKSNVNQQYRQQEQQQQYHHWQIGQGNRRTVASQILSSVIVLSSLCIPTISLIIEYITEAIHFRDLRFLLVPRLLRLVRCRIRSHSDHFTEQQGFHTVISSSECKALDRQYDSRFGLHSVISCRKLRYFVIGKMLFCDVLVCKRVIVIVVVVVAHVGTLVLRVSRTHLGSINDFQFRALR